MHMYFCTAGEISLYLIKINLSEDCNVSDASLF